MEKTNSCKIETDLEPLKKLLNAMLNDSVINNKVTKILKMDSYPRRIVLSNWLEQLRRNNAPQKLIQTLSYLFDDIIAERVYGLFNIFKDKRKNSKRYI